jgi:hypothetical protein
MQSEAKPDPGLSAKFLDLYMVYTTGTDCGQGYSGYYFGLAAPRL